MKQHFLFQSLFIGLLLTLLWGCSDETITSVTDSEKQSERLTVIVTDGGYIASAGEDPLTRAKEEDYKTTFTAGDRIGLYAVKNNAIITGCNNVCLILAADGKWTPPTGTELFYEGANATYYAYYPYQAGMAGKVTTTATDADGFFKPLADGWAPAIDQSDYARYTASDLMTGKCTISNNPGSTRTLTVGLTHQMAMAVVNLTRTKYTLNTDANYTWFTYPDDIEFNGYIPYQANDGSFRYLVKPGQASPILSGSYSNAASATTEWYMTANIAKGNYKNYNVDGAMYAELTHTLTVGDFYMKDGSLISASKATLTDREQANCIGIVFKVGVGAQDDISKYGGELLAIHGYVLSLDQDNLIWGDTSKGWTNTSMDSYEGYAYTQQILPGIAEGKSFPACSWCVNHTPIPTGMTTGWYFPSCQQVLDFVANSATLNTYLGKISGSTLISDKYISSTESGYNVKTYCNGGNAGSSTGYRFGKDEQHNVRAILTF